MSCGPPVWVGVRVTIVTLSASRVEARDADTSVRLSIELKAIKRFWEDQPVADARIVRCRVDIGHNSFTLASFAGQFHLKQQQTQQNQSNRIDSNGLVLSCT